jgi:argininosuccinate synthase
VIALTVDLGGDFNSEVVKWLCQKLAVQWLILDKKQEFANDFVIPAIAAQASYLGGHPICASLSRPLMAKTACEVARDLECNAIIHTSNRSQNSLRRFNGALASLGFKGDFGSPFDLSSIPRELKREVLHGVGINIFDNRIYSTDSSFWGREFEYGELDDPEKLVIPEFLYEWTKLSSGVTKRNLTITFCNGVPTKLDDVGVDFLSLVNQINITAGIYGLGRYVGLEEIENGVKVQEIREMPAAYVLFDAYRRLESGCLSAECLREKMHIEQLWVREAVEGRWYNPLRQAAQAFIQSVAQKVSGTVSYDLDLRSLQVTSVRAENPLYIRNRDQYEQAFGEE